MSMEYNFTVPTGELLKLAGNFGLPLDVDRLIFQGQKKKGFFIEAGAAGGEDFYHVLTLETKNCKSNMFTFVGVTYSISKYFRDKS